jgi:outer membrane lipoprotein-sorting protein
MAGTARAELPPEAQRLERALQKLDGVHAELRQVRHISLTDEDIASDGTLAFKPPHAFRLAYTTPEPQELVVDGDSLWVVLPSERQATRYPFSADEPGSEVFLLFGGKGGTLDDAFEVAQEPWGEYGQALRLMPRNVEPGYPIEEIRLVVGKNGLPERLFYREVTGDTVVIVFTRFRKNPKNLDELTRLRLPEGTEVIDGTPPRLHDGIMPDEDPPDRP